MLIAAALTLAAAVSQSWWRPWYISITGGQTQAQAIAAIETGVLQRFPGAAKLDHYSRFTLIALKHERQLELWGLDGDSWERNPVFPFTGFSGQLGPKLVRGDGQIPEGQYQIIGLNPNSSFHLSLKLNYPNAFDQQQGQEDGRGDLGDNIFRG